MGLENQKRFVKEATEKISLNFKDLGEKVCIFDDSLKIRLFFEIITKGDEASKTFIKENQDLFLLELAEKTKVSCFKWYDFIMRFEWIVREKVPILEIINSEESLRPEVLEVLRKAVEENPEKLSLELVESFISELKQNKDTKESTQETLKKFLTLIFNDQKKHNSIKFKRFTELCKNLSVKMKGKSLTKGFEKCCGFKGSQLSGG